MDAEPEAPIVEIIDSTHIRYGGRIFKHIRTVNGDYSTEMRKTYMREYRLRKKNERKSSGGNKTFSGKRTF
jgi:hypothetical protein